MAETKQSPTRRHAEVTTPERTHGGHYFVPRVDICETQKDLILFAEVPGVRPEEIQMHYDKGELFLHARVKPQEQRGNLVYGEFTYGDYYRAFSIHESIDSTKIEASCSNGVLTVHLPKVAAAQPKQVKIRVE